MILKLVLSASILLHIDHVAATTCHELQQSQVRRRHHAHDHHADPVRFGVALISLNERMNQMIDTISSLLPKSLKKLPPSVPPTPTSSVDYLPGTIGHETNYYIAPPVYSTQSPTPQVVYLPPSYPTLPPMIVPPGHPNPVPTPHQRYAQIETGRHQEYPFITRSSVGPQPSGIYQRYEPPLIYPNPTTSHLVSSSYPPNPFTFIQSPYSAEYTQAYPHEYPLPSPNYYNFPTYAPGVPVYPLPVPMSPSSLNISEQPQKFK